MLFYFYEECRAAFVFAGIPQQLAKFGQKSVISIDIDWSLNNAHLLWSVFKSVMLIGTSWIFQNFIRFDVEGQKLNENNDSFAKNDVSMSYRYYLHTSIAQPDNEYNRISLSLRQRIYETAASSERIQMLWRSEQRQHTYTIANAMNIQTATNRRIANCS